MKHVQNKMIVQQIKTLLDQLDKNENFTQVVNMDNDGIKIVTKLLQLSCDFFWVYDPTTHTIEYYHEDPITKMECKKIYSLPPLQEQTEDSYCEKAREAFHRILLGNSMEEVFEYMEYKDTHTNIYEIHAYAWEEKQHLKIIGTAKVVADIERTMSEIVQAQKKYEQLLSLSNMYIWEFDVHGMRFSANESLCTKLGLEHKSYTLQELEQYVHIVEIDSFLEVIKNKKLQDK